MSSKAGSNDTGSSKGREPLLFCLCGPMGVGKSTISRELVRRLPNLVLSISTTTRSPRAGEVEGREYFFVTKDQFQQKIAAAEFLEHASVGSEFYGTEKRNVEMAREKSLDVVFDIDVQGVKRLKELYGTNVVTIFVSTPSREVLEARIRGRGTDSEEVIKKRLKIAENEIAVLSAPGFSDYVLVNDQLETSVAEIEDLVERVRALRT